VLASFDEQAKALADKERISFAKAYERVYLDPANRQMAVDERNSRLLDCLNAG
jgi:hypothetical protein